VESLATHLAETAQDACTSLKTVLMAKLHRTTYSSELIRSPTPAWFGCVEDPTDTSVHFVVAPKSSFD
jgi:hypothetical protein